jgi:DNA-binding cell septation regulator SpoVG
MRVLELRQKAENGKPLRAFVDIELDGGVVVRELRILQEPNSRPWVACPQLSWRDPGTGQVRYKTVITFPSQLKGEIDLLVLTAWKREKEKLNGVERK